jgi:predicted nucleic acid-binding Zn ribbon protein
MARTINGKCIGRAAAIERRDQAEDATTITSPILVQHLYCRLCHKPIPVADGTICETCQDNIEHDWEVWRDHRDTIQSIRSEFYPY